jgi:hypothetical protein
MKTKKYYTIGMISKSNIKFVEKRQMHDYSIPWFGTVTSINGGGAKLVLWIQISPVEK